MKPDKFLVSISAVVFLAYGAWFVISPGAAFTLITGGSATGGSALVDIRATYGGMSLGVGALLGTVVLNPQWLRAGLLGVLFIMVGMAGGRAIGLITASPGNHPTMWAYLAVEVIAAAAVLFVLIRNRQADSKSG